tara:strand:- start:275 stop:997 length:723 start_codon:yes stop_codon:yes gene_type:complete
MYSVLFHVSGIAILEICFFFYYIGPMETKIFEKTVSRIMAGPIKSLNSLHTQFYGVYPQTGQLIKLVFFGDNNSTQTTDELENDLKEERDEAVKERQQKNHMLFIQIVEYWTILAAASLLIWFIEHKYKLYLKRKQNQVVVDISDDNDNLELTPIRTYRRNSTDETDSEVEEQEKKKYFSDKTKKRMGYVTHYIFFGACIIGFQYLFFQHIVLNYDPLSISEVKYLIFQRLKPELETFEN